LPITLRAKHRIKPPSPWPALGVCLLLAALIWIVFGQTLGHGFVNYDDRVYVVQNQQIHRGLTFSGMAWAFSHEHAGNWHPLTTISHMLDYQLFNLRASGHHFTNVLLHTAAALLLFLVLRRLTGTFWRSAFVAALFAIHPLRAESVAWIAERKDVLSALFFMLTLWTYALYARKRSVGRYIMTAVFLAAGLLSKPMLVSVPFVLLLLDYWPLGRIGGAGDSKERRSPGRRANLNGGRETAAPWNEKQSWSKLIVEKIPFFILCIPSMVATFVIQERSAGAVVQLPFAWRLQNALVTCVTYLWQMIWPVNLAVFYPHPENHLAIWQVAGAALLLLAITFFVFAQRKTRPYLLVGWLWYLVMLIPVIGIVQVGLQGHADRYTYLPHIGLYMAITWWVVELFEKWPARRQILGAAAALIVLCLSACTWKQVSWWKDSETLWRHALVVTRDNDVAHTNLGMFLAEGGRVEEGIAHLQEALVIRSGAAHPHYNLSLALIQSDLGYALARKGSLDEAIEHLHTAVELRPDYPDAHYNLAAALSQEGKTREAIEEYRKTLALRPTDAEAHTSLGNALAQEGHVSEAMEHYEMALQLAPDAVLARNNLAWILSASPDATIRNGARAVDLARQAVDLSGGNNPLFIRTLAAAYAEVGRFPDSVDTIERALRVAEAQGDRNEVSQLQQDAALFRSKIPLRDETLSR
jgi:tetratricopeptide (TPR) repeat protein